MGTGPTKEGAGGGVQSNPPAGQTEQAGARRVTVSTRGRKDARGPCSARGRRPDPHVPARTDPDTRTTGAPLHFLHRTDGAGLLRAMTSSKPGTTSSTCPARATAPPQAPPLREPPAPPPAAAISAYPSLPPPSGAVPWRSGCTSNPPESELARPRPPPPGHAQVPPTVPPPGPGHTPGRVHSPYIPSPTPPGPDFSACAPPGLRRSMRAPNQVLNPGAPPRPPSPASVSPPVSWGQFVP